MRRLRSNASAREDRLWPFGRRAAVLVVPIILVGSAIVIAALRATVRWPGAGSDNLVLIGVFLLSMIPLVLVVLDLLAARGGSVEVRGLKINFSAAVVAVRSITIPPNIGAPGVPVSDSGSQQILDALREAGAHDIAIVDLEEGQAWWDTRLLVLCAGAARLNHPKVIVFKATEELISGRFQGWAEPESLLRLLLASNNCYRDSFAAARIAATQWAAVAPAPPGGVQSQPAGASPLAVRGAFAAYVNGKPNEYAQEQLLAMELAQYEPPSEGINIIKLKALFAPALHTQAIDRDWPSELQIEALLKSDTQYVAITDQGRYEGLLSRGAGHSVILQSLLDTDTAGRTA